LARRLVYWATLRKPYELFPSTEARDWYDEWYERQKKLLKRLEGDTLFANDPSDPTRSLNRTGNLLWKTAGLLAISYDEAPWVRLPRFKEALKLLQVEEEYLERFLSLLYQPPDGEMVIINKIIRVMQRGGGRMTRSDLFNQLRKIKELNPPNVNALPYLTRMKEMGILDFEKEGRAEVYTLVEGWEERSLADGK
jgi:hypothetical protein